MDLQTKVKYDMIRSYIGLAIDAGVYVMGAIFAYYMLSDHRRLQARVVVLEKAVGIYEESAVEDWSEPTSPIETGWEDTGW